jgi:trk system potassium uptake protein TrkH
MGNIGTFPDFGVLVLTLNMWIGRLEVFTVMVLLTPAFWKH